MRSSHSCERLGIPEPRVCLGTGIYKLTPTHRTETKLQHKIRGLYIIVPYDGSPSTLFFYGKKRVDVLMSSSSQWCQVRETVITGYWCQVGERDSSRSLLSPECSVLRGRELMRSGPYDSGSASGEEVFWDGEQGGGGFRLN